MTVGFCTGWSRSKCTSAGVTQTFGRLYYAFFRQSFANGAGRRRSTGRSVKSSLICAVWSSNSDCFTQMNKFFFGKAYTLVNSKGVENCEVRLPANMAIQILEINAARPTVGRMSRVDRNFDVEYRCFLSFRFSLRQTTDFFSIFSGRESKFFWLTERPSSSPSGNFV